MKLQDLIIEFLRENGLKLTERYLEEDRGSKPKLIRFVRGNKKYSIVFVNNEPTLHLFKEKLHKKKPHGAMATVHGDRKIGAHNWDRTKIEVDLNNKDSFKQILDFL